MNNLEHFLTSTLYSLQFKQLKKKLLQKAKTKGTQDGYNTIPLSNSPPLPTEYEKEVFSIFKNIFKNITRHIEQLKTNAKIVQITKDSKHAMLSTSTPKNQTAITQNEVEISLEEISIAKKIIYQYEVELMVKHQSMFWEVIETYRAANQEARIANNIELINF